MKVTLMLSVYVLITLVIWGLYARHWYTSARRSYHLGGGLLALQLLLSSVFLALIFTRVP